MGFDSGLGLNANNFGLQNPFDEKKEDSFGIKGLSLKTSETAKPLFDEATKIATVSTPQGTQAVDPHKKITEMTQGNGERILTDSNNSAGNFLGKTAGKTNDKDLKPFIKTSFDAEGNQTAFGKDRNYDTTTQTKISDGVDGSKITNTAVYDKDGSTISQSIITKEKDGAKSVTSFVNKEEGGSVSKQARYDKDGKLIEGTTTTTTKDGKEETVVQKREADGSYSMKTTKADGTVETAKYDKDGKPLETKKETPSAAKETHKEGSLGDIRQEKEKIFDDKKEKITQKLKDGEGKAAKKYQNFDKQANAIDAKIKELDPVKDKAKIESLEGKKDKLKARQDKFADKVTEKTLKNDANFQKLEKAEAEEQKQVDKYKDFKLTDKDGNKLDDGQISDMKDDLFDKDGKILSRKDLEEKGIKKEYTDEVIANNPMKILTDKDASKQEKTQALLATILNANAGYTPTQTAMGLQGQNKTTPMNTIASGFTQFALAFTNTNSSSANSGNTPIKFDLASSRLSKD